MKLVDPSKPTGLQRHFGLLQAVALNVTMVVGAGIFVTIPPMLEKMPGPYALLGWIGAGALILVDGLIWSELGAALPGSGGSYLYLLESYGPKSWGRLLAFLFIWQFMLSGPLELASGLIAMDMFSQALSPAWEAFNNEHTLRIVLWEKEGLGLTFSPARLGCIGVGTLLIGLVYQKVTALGRLTLFFWLAVLGIIAWLLVEGGMRFSPSVAFDWPSASDRQLYP